MLGRRRRSRLRRHIGYVPLFKFHQLRDHREAHLQVGHTRIVFVSELLYHSLKMNVSSFDPILSQIGTFQKIVSDVAHSLFPRLDSRNPNADTPGGVRCLNSKVPTFRPVTPICHSGAAPAWVGLLVSFYGAPPALPPPVQLLDRIRRGSENVNYRKLSEGQSSPTRDKKGLLWSNDTFPSPPASPSSKMQACCKPTADDGLMMIHTSVVMVRCPATGRELSTGVEMDAETFERLTRAPLPPIFARAIRLPRVRLARSGERGSRAC
jgi:hypothetical protein